MKSLFVFLSFGCLVLALATQVIANKPIPAMVYAAIACVAGKIALGHGGPRV